VDQVLGGAAHLVVEEGVVVVDHVVQVAEQLEADHPEQLRPGDHGERVVGLFILRIDGDQFLVPISREREL